MIVTDKRLDWHSGATWTIWGLYDVHLDSTGCDLKRLQRDIQTIKDDPLARVVIGGDFNDLTNALFDPRSQRSNVPVSLAQEDDYADKCIEWNCDVLSPIADKIDVYLTGNHEDGYARRHGTNVARITAHRLNVPYSGYCGYLRHFIGHKVKKRPDPLVDGVINGWLHHGAGGSSPVTKGMIGVTRTQTDFRFHYAMSGHIHTRVGADSVVIEPAGNFGEGRIKEIPICSIVCGTYLKTYPEGSTTTYAARGRASPAPLGAGRVYIDMIRQGNDRLLQCRIN